MIEGYGVELVNCRWLGGYIFTRYIQVRMR